MSSHVLVWMQWNGALSYHTSCHDYSVAISQQYCLAGKLPRAQPSDRALKQIRVAAAAHIIEANKFRFWVVAFAHDQNANVSIISVVFTKSSLWNHAKSILLNSDGMHRVVHRNWKRNIKPNSFIIAKLSQAKLQLQLSWLALASLNFT